MARHCGWKSVIVLGLLCAGTLAFGQASQQIARVDANGASVTTNVGPLLTTEPLVAAPRASGIVWTQFVTDSIAQSVAMSDTTNESWVGENVNSQRLSYYQTVGNGIPQWEFPFTDNPDVVIVASAADVSLGVVGTHTTASGVKLQSFDRNHHPTPGLWGYGFEAPFVNIGAKAISIASDGHLVLAAAQATYPDQRSLVVVLDGVTGAELTRKIIPQLVGAVELSEDATRAVLTEGATTEIVDIPTLNSLFSFQVSGGGGTARISRDGKVVAAGGFNYMVVKDMGGGTWSTIYSGSEGNQWFGAGIGLSGDGSLMFLVSYYYTNYLTLVYRSIDLVHQVELARITTTGTGGFQDTVQRAEVSADGRVYVVASWGTQDMVHPQTQIFDRMLNRLGGISSPGSPFDMDLERSGQYLLIGCKHVHANTFGNGGDVFVYAVPILVPGDLNCDGVINFGDINPFVLALSNPAGYNTAFPWCNILNGDTNGDGLVNFGDINPFVAILTGS